MRWAPHLQGQHSLQTALERRGGPCRAGGAMGVAGRGWRGVAKRTGRGTSLQAVAHKGARRRARKGPAEREAQGGGNAQEFRSLVTQQVGAW